MRRLGSGRALRLVAAGLLVGILGCGKGDDEPRNPDGRDKIVRRDKGDDGGVHDGGFVRRDDGPRDDKPGPTDGLPRDRKIIPLNGGKGGKLDPPLKRGPDPKVVAAKKAEAQKQLALQKLCFDALEKKTRATAMKALEAGHPTLAPHIATLAVDDTPDEVQKACKAIKAMGPSVRGAWPAVNIGALRMQGSGKFGAEDSLIAAMDTLAWIAPDEPVVLETLLVLSQFPDIVDRSKKEPRVLKDHSRLRAAAVSALGQSAPGNALAGQRRIVKDGLDVTLKDASIAEHAAKTLHEVARDCPQVRLEIVAALHGAVRGPIAKKDQATRRAAVEALAPCGYAVTAAAKDTLADLKINDPAAPVRNAATVTLAEVERQYRIVPQLLSVNIVEGAIPAPLYQAAFATVEGKPLPSKLNEKDVSFQLPNNALATAPRDDDAWFVLAALSRLPKRGDQDHVTTRWTALKILADWVLKDRDRRKEGAALFAAALHDATVADDALNGLSRCGTEGVRQFRAAKTKIDPIPVYRSWLTNPEPDVRAAALEGLADTRPTSSRGLDPILERLDAKEEAVVTRAAAKGLLHLDRKHAGLAQTVMERIDKLGDPQTEKTLRQVVKNMGFDGSSKVRFQESVLLSKDADADTKERTFDKIDLDAFAQGVSPKAKEVYVDVWWAVTEPRLTIKTTPAEAERRAAYSTHMRKMCQAFGGQAKKLAPELVNDLMEYTRERNTKFTPLAAVVALEAIGPVPGVDGRTVLQRAADTRFSSERQVREAATRALAKFK